MTIEKIEVMAYDDNGDKNLEVRVKDEAFDATRISDDIIRRTAGTAGYQNVDATNSMIVVEVIPVGLDIAWESSSMLVRGVRVTYTEPGREPF